MLAGPKSGIATTSLGGLPQPTTSKYLKNKKVKLKNNAYVEVEREKEKKTEKLNQQGIREYGQLNHKNTLYTWGDQRTTLHMRGPKYKTSTIHKKKQQQNLKQKKQTQGIKLP